MWLPWWRNTWLSLLFLLGKFCRALWPRNFTSEAKLNLTKLGKYTANITSLHWGSKNLKNIRPDGLEKIIASLMMDNFKKKRRKKYFGKPWKPTKNCEKKTYNCISSDGNVCKKNSHRFHQNSKDHGQSVTTKVDHRPSLNVTDIDTDILHQSVRVSDR